MPDAPASPKADRLAAPSWLDTRLVLGVLLVLVSVVVGARVLSAADRSSTVYTAARDLEPGATLQSGDLRPEEVRLDAEQVARLVPVPATGEAPTGYVALHGLRAGDLVLRSDLIDERGTDLRQFTLNIAPGHAPPDLRGNQLVDVWVTPSQDRAGQHVRPPVSSGAQASGAQAPGAQAPGAQASGAQASGEPRLVLASVAVASAPGAGSLTGERSLAVVLDVAPADVRLLVQAVAEGEVDLVRQLGQRAEPAPVATRAAGSATRAAG